MPIRPERKLHRINRRAFFMGTASAVALAATPVRALAPAQTALTSGYGDFATFQMLTLKQVCEINGISYEVFLRERARFTDEMKAADFWSGP